MPAELESRKPPDLHMEIGIVAAPFDTLDAGDVATRQREDDFPAPSGTRPKSGPRPFSVAAEDVGFEGWDHPVYGNVRWRTLISGDRAPSAGLVLGIAEMQPGGWLGQHRHAPPEFYLGLSGSGTATIDGAPHRIEPGTAVFIPGNAEHGIIAGSQGLTFAYGFGVDGFDSIAYVFSADGQSPSKG